MVAILGVTGVIRSRGKAKRTVSEQGQLPSLALPSEPRKIVAGRPAADPSSERISRGRPQGQSATRSGRTARAETLGPIIEAAGGRLTARRNALIRLSRSDGVPLLLRLHPPDDNDPTPDNGNLPVPPIGHGGGGQPTTAVPAGWRYQSNGVSRDIPRPLPRPVSGQTG